MSTAQAFAVTILTEEQFDQRFPLLINHLDAHASFNGCMFET
jgi:hypothetical protein